MSLAYKRILLKLSGEVLAGKGGFGHDPQALAEFAGLIKRAHDAGAQVGLVIGGGNFHRGAQSGVCTNRVKSDQMGMLATVMNGLAMQDNLINLGLECLVMTAISMQGVTETFSATEAVKALDERKIVIFSGGTGCPFFTTDSAAALRALEIDADVMIKATKVDGVYDKDPVKHSDAVLFAELGYDEVLARNLKVMDAAAISLCRDNDLEVRVINVNVPGNLEKLLNGEVIGSKVFARREL